MFKIILKISLITISLTLFAQKTSTIKTQWVDSVYNKMTIEERLGQLLMLPITIDKKTNYQTTIHNNNLYSSIAGVILNGKVTTQNVVKNVKRMKQQNILPLIMGINLNHENFRVEDNAILSNIPFIGSINNKKTIQKYGHVLGKQIKLLGIDMVLLPNTIVANNKNYFESLSSSPTLRVDKQSIIINSLKNNKLLTAKKYQTPRSGLSPDEIKESIPTNQKDVNLNVFELDNDALNKPEKTIDSTLLEVLNNYDIIISSDYKFVIERIKLLMLKKKFLTQLIENKVKLVINKKFSLPREYIIPDNLKLKTNNPHHKSLLNEVYEESITVLQGDSLLPITMLKDKKYASISFGEGVVFEKYLDYYTHTTHHQSDDLDHLSSDYFSEFETIFIGFFNHEINHNLIQSINNKIGNQKIVYILQNPFDLNYIEDFSTKIITYANNDITQKIIPQIIFGGLSSKGIMPFYINAMYSLDSGSITKEIGRIGFSTPESVEMDSKVLSTIDKIVLKAIKDKAMPGCQIAISRRGKVVFNKSYGYHTYDSLKKVDDNDLYDLASITKVAATTQLLMKLYEKEMIDLDKKVSAYLKELKNTNKEDLTIRDILTHQAGLWPYLPFWRQTLDNTNYYFNHDPDEIYKYQVIESMFARDILQDSLWNWVVNSKLREKEFRIPYDYKYSDMGYYLLQRLIEQLYKKPMNEVLEEKLYKPLGLSTMIFLPLNKFELNKIVPTEFDSVFRKKLVHGYVHDPGAAMKGGISGHAGLFSNAIDLLKLMQMILQEGTYGEHQYFKQSTIRTFTSPSYNQNRRGLGWDKPVVGKMNSPSSYYASKSSFGHSGFTGTITWVDPEFDLVYVFLSNRIFPDASNTKLLEENIRTRIQDELYKAIWSYTINNKTYSIN